MINIARLAKKMTQKFNLADWAIIKIDLLVIGILLAKLFPVLISLHRGWYAGFAIAVEAYFIGRIINLK